MAKQIAKREVGLGLNIAEFAKNAKTADQLLDNLTKGRTVKIGAQLDLGSAQQALQKIIDFKTVSIKFAPDVKDLFGVMEKGIADFEKQGSKNLARMNRSFLDDFKEGFKNVSFKLDDGNLIKGYDAAIKHAEQLLALTERQVDAIDKVKNANKQQIETAGRQTAAIKKQIVEQEKLSGVLSEQAKIQKANQAATEVFLDTLKKVSAERKKLDKLVTSRNSNGGGYSTKDGRYDILHDGQGWYYNDKVTDDTSTSDGYFSTLNDAKKQIVENLNREISSIQELSSFVNDFINKHGLEKFYEKFSNTIGSHRAMGKHGLSAESFLRDFKGIQEQIADSQGIDSAYKQTQEFMHANQALAEQFKDNQKFVQEWTGLLNKLGSGALQAADATEQLKKAIRSLSGETAGKKVTSIMSEDEARKWIDYASYPSLQSNEDKQYIKENGLQVLEQLEHRSFALSEKLAPVDEMVARISKNASVKDVPWEQWPQEAVKVAKALSTMYDEGIRDTEEYVTLQYRLMNLYDKMIAQAGGVKGSGAKSASELRGWINNSIKRDFGYSIGGSYAIDALWGQGEFSIFETNSKIKPMLELAAQLQDYKGLELTGGLGASIEKTELKRLNAAITKIRESFDLENVETFKQISELYNKYGSESDKLFGSIPTIEANFANVREVYDQLIAKEKEYLDSGAKSVSAFRERNLFLEQSVGLTEKLKNNEQFIQQRNNLLGMVTEGIHTSADAMKLLNEFVQQTTVSTEQQKARLQEIYEIADRNRNRDLKKEHSDSTDGLRQRIGELQTLIPQLQAMQEEVSKIGVTSDSVNFKTSFAAAGVLAEAVANKTKDLQFYNTTLENTIKLEEFAAKAYEKYGIKTRSKKFSSDVMQQYKDLLLQLNNGLSVEDAMKALDKAMNVGTGIEVKTQPTIEQGAISEAVLESTGNKPVEVPVKPVVEGDLSKLIMGSSGETYAGKKAIGFKYAVMSVDNLTMSHDAYGKVNPNYPTELQPRDRSRIASIAQILGMVKNINPSLLTSSPTAQNGSPIVSKDGIVVGGNARSAALLEAYRTGHADGYKSYIIEHAKEFGLDPKNMPNNPVLVRVVDIDGGLDALSKQLNESTTSGYSATEQALVNEELVMRVISKLNLDESANLNSQANKDFVHSFINLLSDNQKNEMVTKDGSLSAVGAVKVRQAIAGAAYGSREMLENLELISPDLVNISNALISGAAKAADIRYGIESGSLNDLGVVSTMLKGLDLLKSARSQNQKISEYLDQGSLFGNDYAAEDVAIGKFLEANVRNAANLRNMVDTILDFARSAGDPNQIGFDGFGAATLSDTIRGAFAAYAERYQKSINYDELIKGYLPAEAGSRSDKRVDRTNLIETTETQVAAEKELSGAVQETTKSKQQQSQASQQALEGTQSQVDAETKLNNAIREGYKHRRNALQVLRDADKITQTGYKFDEVFNRNDLEEKITNFVTKITNDEGLKIGKVQVSEFTDDGVIGWIQYYNSESKKALEQTFELQDGVLQLGKMKFSQDFKALDAQVLAQRKNDYKELLSLTKRLNETSLEFYKAQSLGIDTSSYNLSMEKDQQRIAEISKRITLTAQEEAELLSVGNKHLIQKANLLNSIESKEQKVIETQRKAAAAEEKKTQENIDKLNQRFNESMKQWTVDGSFNNLFPPELQNQINQFKTTLSSLGKDSNFAQLNSEFDQIAQKAKEATKAGQDLKNAYYKDQFQSGYKYNNGKTAQDQATLGSMGDFYKKEEEKAQQFNNNIRSIYDRLMSTMKEYNKVSEKLNNLTLQDKGTGLYGKQMDSLQTDKSALLADLRVISEEANKLFSGTLSKEPTGFMSFFQNLRVSEVLKTEEVENFGNALRQLENIKFNFASKLSEQLQPVAEKLRLLQQMVKDGVINNSNVAKDIFEKGSIFSAKYENAQKFGTAYDTKEAMRYAQAISEILSLYENAAKAEQAYFANKKQYQPGMNMDTVSGGSSTTGTLQKYSEDAAKAAQAVETTEQKLINAANQFAKESNASGIIIKNFTQSADGISHLDFSILDRGTDSVRNFRMEMGQVNTDKFITDTSTAFDTSFKNAESQLTAITNLIKRLKDANIGTDSSQAKSLIDIQSRLESALQNKSGTTADQYTKLTQEAQKAAAETEKLFKQQEYFKDKTQFTSGKTSMSTLAEDAKKASQATKSAQQDLTDAANKFAQQSGASGAIIKSFTQDANGISRLDFSVLDRGTDAVRNFRIEMGQADSSKFVTETSGALNASFKNAEAQLQSVTNLIGRLKESNVNMDQSSVVKLLQLQSDLDSALQSKGTSNAKFNQLTKDAKTTSAEVEKLINQLNQMNEAIANGTAQDLGKVNKNGNIYTEMVNGVNKFAEANNAASVSFGKFNEKAGTLEFTLNKANGTTESFKASMSSLNGQMTAQSTGVGKLTTQWGKFGSIVTKAGKQLFTALVGYNMMYKAIAEVRKGINYVKEIDLALTELKKVTDETEATYKKFLQTASGTAAEIGSTVSAFTEATANFARLGYTMEESATMAESAVVYKNVADGLDTVEESTESIISTMKAFGIASDDTMSIVDMFNEVGNNFAITSAGIGEAFKRSASALAAGNNTIEESIGLVTAANSVIQNPEQVGTALKTLSLRIRGVKTELEEAGLETEGMAETTATLQSKLLALTHGKVDILIDEDTFKSTTQILREMSEVWEEMTDMEQAAALELIGGKRQAKNCPNVQKCA